MTFFTADQHFGHFNIMQGFAMFNTLKQKYGIICAV